MADDSGAVVNGSGPLFYSRLCPHCFEPIHAQAVVKEFLEPPDWTFYGERGRRVIICRTDYFIHFAAMVEDKTTHRLAWLFDDEPRQLELFKGD